MMVRSRLLPFIATSGTALLIYLLTAAPDLSWAHFGSDGGELITAAVTLGVPHPSGYPLYILFGKLFSFIPVGTIAFRFNLFSAVCVALAAGLASLSTAALLTHYPLETVKTQPAARYTLTPTQFAALAAGLTFAFAPLVWGQALISEVYGLNMLCLALFLWALTGKRPSWQAGLFLGFAVTTHLTSLLMLPLAILWLQKRRQFFLGFLAGLTPFLCLPLLAQTGSPLIWGEPARPAGWWAHISGQIYRDLIFALPLTGWWQRLSSWLVLLPQQFLWLGFIIVIVAFVQAGKNPPLFKRCLLLAGTALLYFLYAFGYHTPDAVIFTLPAFLLLALCLGPGMQPLGWPALGLPLLLLLINFQSQDLRQLPTVRPSAEALLMASPDGALLFSEDAATTFSLWYFHVVEQQRPDLIIVDANLFAFDWYRHQLRKEHENLFMPQADDLELFFIRNGTANTLCRVEIKVQAGSYQPLNSCLDQDG